MEDIAALALEIERDRIRRARKRTVEQKLLGGGDLFDEVRQRMIWGIKSDFPHFDEQQVLQELRRQLAISRRLESRQ